MVSLYWLKQPEALPDAVKGKIDPAASPWEHPYFKTHSKPKNSTLRNTAVKKDLSLTAPHWALGSVLAVFPNMIFIPLQVYQIILAGTQSNI